MMSQMVDAMDAGMKPAEAQEKKAKKAYTH